VLCADHYHDGSELALGASAVETSDEEEDARTFSEAQKVAAAAAEASGLAYEGRQRLASLQQLQADVAERAAHTRRALYMLS
jgi:hypothetical protein